MSLLRKGNVKYFNTETLKVVLSLSCNDVYLGLPPYSTLQITVSNINRILAHAPSIMNRVRSNTYIVNLQVRENPPLTYYSTDPIHVCKVRCSSFIEDCI